MHLLFFMPIFLILHHAWTKDGGENIVPPVIHDIKIMDPVPIENVQGRSILSLYCNVSESSAASIQWSFNGKKFQKDVPFSGVKSDTVRHTINGYFLNITKVRGENSEEPGKMYDSGRYRCIATNKAGSVFLEKNIKIRVMGYFKPGARFDRPFTRVDVVVGRSFIHNCPPHVTGYGTTYNWGIVLQDGNGKPRIEPNFPSFINNHSFLTSDGRLVYAVVLEDDITESTAHGGYVCILQNFGQSVYSNQQVLWKYDQTKFVDRAPNIIAQVPEVMNVFVGTTYKITCGATGYPVSRNRWFYGETEVKLQSSTSTLTNIDFVEIRGNGYQLVIHNVTKSTDIRCVAENKVGSQLSMGNLTAQIPTFWQEKFPESIDVSLNSILTLTCNASGVPMPTYEWFHNSTKMVSSAVGNKIIRKYRKNGVSYLTIKTSNLNDYGIYICVARNDLESLTQSVFLKVKKDELASVSARYRSNYFVAVSMCFMVIFTMADQ